MRNATRKLTAKHKLAITELMFKNIASYINIYCTDNTNTSSTDMYVGDIAHNNNALATFNKDNNVQNLHNAIMYQDTLVREHFVAVLQYIEKNDLISANNFCCI